MKHETRCGEEETSCFWQPRPCLKIPTEILARRGRRPRSWDRQPRRVGSALAHICTHLAACVFVYVDVTQLRGGVAWRHATFVLPALQETQRHRVSSGKRRERWPGLTPVLPFLPPSAPLFLVSWWGSPDVEGSLDRKREVKERERKHLPGDKPHCPRLLWTSSRTEPPTENTKQSSPFEMSKFMCVCVCV